MAITGARVGIENIFDTPDAHSLLKKLEADITQDGIENRTEDLFFVILGDAVNMVKHPTILDLLLSSPDMWVLSTATGLPKRQPKAERATKLAEVKISKIMENARDANDAVENATDAGKVARGTKFED
ncbi:hypothetical protein EYZ11_008261 [Aspergillus tanneri]|uniref:Uncharacterized protein n=1 Tax=Aspergillus tanneri TaxID=1220188 RepID=A0A4S3JAX3_9EURO|nr:hypothetical protein EYZ11_008261 [Aspergillus tanneri]